MSGWDGHTLLLSQFIQFIEHDVSTYLEGVYTPLKVLFCASQVLECVVLAHGGRCDEEGERSKRRVHRVQQKRGEKLAYLSLMKTCSCSRVAMMSLAVDCFIFFVIFHHQREVRVMKGRWCSVKMKNEK